MTQTVDGISFHSKKEAAYYSMLKLERRAKEIDRFERQVKFPLNCNGKFICNHYVDFVVVYLNGGKEVREVKGFATAVWDLKRKLFEANYPDIPYKVIW